MNAVPGDPQAPPEQKIPIRNAWYLLLYAWDLAAWRGTFDGAVERSPALLGLLARVLASATGSLVRRNLARAFATNEASIRGVRGRIDFWGSVRRLDFEAGRAHCTFPLLTVDTLPNRIIRATLERLVRDPRVVTEKVNERAALLGELRSVIRAMDGVTPSPVTALSFRQLNLTRNDQAYVLPLAICELVHRLEMPSEAVGDHALTALLRDEVTFHRLFERFLRNFWRTHLPEYRVNSERLSWFDALESNPRVPAMQTDVVLERPQSGGRLVVDAKYYKDALSKGPYGDDRRYISAHLYQMYAYLRTQEHRSEAHRGAEGMLVYPTTDVHLDDVIAVQGHSIRIATVSLASSWTTIHERLLALARGEMVERDSQAPRDDREAGRIDAE